MLEEANSHYRALRSAEAVRLYREYLAQYADRADVRTYLGAALLNMHQPREALEEANRAIKLDDRYAKAYTLAGRIYAEQQQWELSRECFEQAVLLDPGDRETWYFFGRSSYEANRFEQAIESYVRALKLGAGQSRVYENLGLAYEALSQSEDAEKAYRRAVELPGSTYRSYVAYGMFLFKQGRMTESLRLLEQAFRLEPECGCSVRIGPGPVSCRETYRGLSSTGGSAAIGGMPAAQPSRQGLCHAGQAQRGGDRGEISDELPRGSGSGVE